MILGYLTTYYPQISHSFIRREILALESLGHVVRRYAIRRGGFVVDPVDLVEWDRTRALLRAGGARIALAVLLAMGRPGRFFGALRLAVRAGRRSERGVLRHLAYLAEACVLLRWCRSDGVEHLHAHFGSNPASVAMLCRALGGPPYSFTAHGIEVFDAPGLMVLDEKVSRSAFTIGVSQFARSQLCRWSSPRDWDRIHVVRCGVDDQILSRPPQPVPDVQRLVCVSRFSPEKGHLTLIRALARLREQGRVFEVVLVGDGPMREELEAFAGRLGVLEQLRFAGWANGAGVIDEILASRALVLPSFSEGLPVVLMEALALGRPCIASQITGVPELVEQGCTGWLVPAGSDEALARAMAEALDADPAELDRMGRLGAKRVAALHDARTEAAHLAKLFAERG